MEHSSKVLAVLMHDDSTMTNSDYDLENLGIYDIDPGLKTYKDHFRYGMGRYMDQKKLIEKYESGLEEFAEGII